MDAYLALGSWYFKSPYVESTITAKVKESLHIGGMGQAGQKVLVAVAPGSGSELDSDDTDPTIPVTSLSVDGLGENLDTNEAAYGSASAGDVVSVNLSAGVPFHFFADSAGAYFPVTTTVHAALTDPNPGRLNLGVGEEVICSFLPTPSFGLDWTNSAGSISGGDFIAPSKPCTATVKALVTGHKEAFVEFLPFNIEAPSGVDHAMITSTHIRTYDLGEAGAAMGLNVWIAPTDVSFYRVRMSEVGEDTAFSGYFADTNLFPNPTLKWHHWANGVDSDHNWVVLSEENVFQDVAGLGGDLPIPWFVGEIDCTIPVVWQIGSTGPTNSVSSGRDEQILINSDGTVFIHKFGKTVTRDIANNVVPDL